MPTGQAEGQLYLPRISVYLPLACGQALILSPVHTLLYVHIMYDVQEVHLRGKKSFGFQYETRLFVSAVEEGSVASEYLLPGDEIVQV